MTKPKGGHSHGVGDMWRGATCVVLCLLSIFRHATANTTDMTNTKDTTDTANIPLTADIAQIEQRLARLQAQSNTQVLDNANAFGAFGELDNSTQSGVPISRLDGTALPIGMGDGKSGQHDAIFSNFDDMVKQSTHQTDNQTTDQSHTTQGDTQTSSTDTPLDSLDPANYLPDYQQSDKTKPQTDNDIITNNTSPNVLKRTYNRLFNNGLQSSSRLKATIYQAKFDEGVSLPKPPSEPVTSTGELVELSDSQWYYESDMTAFIQSLDERITLQKVDDKQEPYANIKAALNNITVDSVPSFSVALPRLKAVVEDAAKAVGYYDVRFQLKHTGNGNIDVIIHQLGEPVTISSQVVDIRGAGADFDGFVKVKQSLEGQENTPFSGGVYEGIKTQINTTQSEYGFFDGQWINHSVDVILPDNVADVNLVYDTGEQYVFDKVVFFTIDPQTNEFTTDPAKLPVRLPLLQKLVTFNQDDGFNRSQVNQLSNQLLATGYFNTANVETVMPSPPNLNADNLATPQESTPEATLENTPETTSMVLDESENITAQIAPIDFSASQDLLDKLALVTAKANRLYDAPDDRVLAQTNKQSTSLLGKVSNAITHVVQKVLPDESGDMPTLPEGENVPTLAGRKTPEQVFADKKVPLYVFVMADKPKDAQIGLGWGTDTGTRASAKLEHKLLNNGGYQAGAEVFASQIDKGASFYITRPWTHPNNDKLKASWKFYEEQIEQSDSSKTLTTRSFEGLFGRNIVANQGWNRSYFVRYRLDDLQSNSPTDTLEDLPVQFSAGNASQEAVLFGASLSKSTQNNPTAPTQGFRQYYSLEAGSQALKTDTDMAIFKAGVGGMLSFGDNAYGNKRAHQLVGRLDAGYLWADDFESVPYKLRFFAGGDSSIRGYSYNSLSPVSTKGYLTGGQILAVGSAEYNYELREGLRVATFADIGGAYSKDFGDNTRLGYDTKLGVGVGVRWASPVGTVRVDIAKGIEDAPTPIRLHFLIGLPF